MPLTAAMTLEASLPVAGQEPRRPGQEAAISRAVFADGQLWLLSDAGVISSISPSSDDRFEVALPELALDLWLQEGQPAVVTCRRYGCTEWALRWRGGDGEWSVKARIATTRGPLHRDLQRWCCHHGADASANC